MKESPTELVRIFGGNLMQLGKCLPALAFWTVMAISGISHGLESQKVKSYREWKSQKVQEAIGRIVVTKTQIQVAKSKDPNLAISKGSVEAKSGSDFEKLESQLQQDQSGLDMAKELSVTDYLVGYLTKLQDTKAAFNEVAGKLTSSEVAELMAAYATNVFGTHSSEIPPSATNLSIESAR